MRSVLPTNANTDTRTQTNTDTDTKTSSNADNSTDTRTQTNTDTDTKTSASTDNSTDTRTQTTAPVSAQSPNINIYNINMSPNAMATDSAPVNVDGLGNNAQPAANSAIPGIPAGIIALAPSSNVSSVKQAVPAQPAPREPAVAMASASIVTTAPQPTTIAASPAPVAPSPAPSSQPSASPSILLVTPPAPQAAQPQTQQPQQVLVAASLPKDVGTAYICNMPDPNNGKIYRVQVGAYQNTWHAKEAYDHLTMVGFKPAYERYGDYIRVVISGIRSFDIPAVARLIGKVGFKEALVREEN